LRKVKGKYYKNLLKTYNKKDSGFTVDAFNMLLERVKSLPG
jgi:hypothetical protein